MKIFNLHKKIFVPTIELYFYRSKATYALQATPLLLLLLLTLTLAYQYWQLSNDISLKTDQLTQKIESSLTKKAIPLMSPQETLYVEKALNDIYFPWAIPFQILEASHDEQVSLIEVHHEPSKHDIRITAQTADIDTMFIYIKKIKNTPNVRRVILNSQESLDDETHPIMFTLTISWI